VGSGDLGWGLRFIGRSELYRHRLQQRCHVVSLWSAITGGTHYGNFQLTGAAAANSAGQYTVTLLNLNGSAT